MNYSKIIISSLLVIFYANTFSQCMENCFLEVVQMPNCENKTIELEAVTNASFVAWKQDGDIISTTSNITIDISTDADYTSLTAVAGSKSNNLLTNGDFESGNTGFTSDYDFTPMSDTLFNNGDYNITSNPNILPAFVAIEDHTGNQGNMLIADASKFAYKAVYRTKVNVVQGQQYTFSMWASNIHKNFTNPTLADSANTAHVGVYIDSVFIDDIVLPKNISWNELRFDWEADKSGSVEIAIKSKNEDRDENDFALDDISLTTTVFIEREVKIIPVSCDTPSLDVFSPDGDGNHDQYHIDISGEANIYNVDGILVKTLKTPAFWDGSTNQGSLARSGYYVVVINKNEIKKVSLIR